MHPRRISPRLTDSLSDTPVVLINGARQSGKSTLVQAHASSTGAPRQYRPLDDVVVLNAARSDPAGFINGLQGAVTLDEVQRVPELFLAIKAALDRQRQPGRFLLTGSADVVLLPGIADLLAGRMEVLSLWPLWHYRTQANIEVDFILENRLDQISGVEVKASATLDGKDFKGLRHLQ